jgi:hypothetical protein
MGSIRKLALFLVITTGCGAGVPSGGRFRKDGPVDRRVQGLIAASWKAVSIPPDRPFLGNINGSDYAAANCPGASEEERVVIRRVSTLEGGVADQEEIFAGLLAFYRGQGFTIQRYEAKAPVRRHSFAAQKGDLGAFVVVDRTGYTSIEAVAGACAVADLDGERDLDRKVTG